MRNIPYNARLHKMKIKDNPQCRECNQKEDILHLYWQCPNAQRLWERLKSILEESEIQLEDWSPELCLLGSNLQERDNQKKMLISLLCLLTKHFIHLKKCSDEVGEPNELELYIRRTYQLEQEIAIQRGTEAKIAKKWTTIVSKLWTKKPEKQWTQDTVQQQGDTIRTLIKHTRKFFFIYIKAWWEHN